MHLKYFKNTHSLYLSILLFLTVKVNNVLFNSLIYKYLYKIKTSNSNTLG